MQSVAHCRVHGGIFIIGPGYVPTMDGSLQFKSADLRHRPSSKKGGGWSAWPPSEFGFSHHAARAPAGLQNPIADTIRNLVFKHQTMVAEHHGLATPALASVALRSLLPVRRKANDDCPALAEGAPGARRVAAGDGAKTT